MDINQTLLKIRKKHDGPILSNIFYEMFVRSYINTYSRKFIQLASFRKCQLPPCKIFLLGCYNSGTTILRDILKSHPQITGMPREGVRFTDVFPDMQEGGWIRMAYQNRHYPACLFSSEECQRRLERDWGFWANKKSEFFLEKSITHSFRIPFLKETFPDAFFIGITRDGYCSTEGILRRAKPIDGAAKTLNNNTYPIELCAKQWVYINKAILASKEDSLKIKHIKFEDFVNYPHEILYQIFDFLGASTNYLSVKGNVVSVDKKNFEIKNPNPESRQRFPKNKINEFNAHAADIMHYFNYGLM